MPSGYTRRQIVGLFNASLTAMEQNGTSVTPRGHDTDTPAERGVLREYQNAAIPKSDRD